jgi:uncharacterized protein (DUF433 family)
MRLHDQQVARLQKYARQLGKSPGETSALIVEEKLREEEFAFIEFRASPVGRQAYMKGSRLTVWWIVHVAQHYGLDAEKTAEHFQRPIAWVRAALNYYRAFPEEINLAIQDYRSIDFESIKRAFPNAELFTVNLTDPD